MLFRVALATLLLLAVVAVAIGEGRSENLGGAFGRFVFALFAITYGASLVYAVLLPRVRDPVAFAYVQIAIDLVLTSLLVHATGGGQSPFHFLYLVDIVAVALLPGRHGALKIAAASALLMAATSLLGYLRLLPVVPGQVVFPWDMSLRELMFRLALNLAGVASVGALGASLSTQSQRAGERLVDHERYAGDLASLHENTIRCLSSGLVTVTPNGLITSINEAACEILGLDRARALGAPLAASIPGLVSLLAEAGLVGTVRRQEVDAVRPDGLVRRLGVSATPLSDHKGRINGRVIHFQDLTDLRRMELAVQRAERLASIGRLAANIAHEIRNPLASISGSVEILKTLPGADADTRQLVDITVRETDRLNRLITDLLEYARPSSEERRTVDLSEIAHEVATSLLQDKRARPPSVLVEAPAPVEIDAAAGQIRQVFWNLLRNACEAMPDGGTLRVRVDHEELSSGSREAIVEVSDTGVGIAEADLDHVFEPFFTRGKAHGTGLGLATVARIVEDHKGTVEVQSEAGRGTTFTVRFPAARTS
jgi:two-component system sensor histidine kinase PilS (NtrC family)